MLSFKPTKINFIQLALWTVLLLSSSAIIYHVRWLATYLLDSDYHRVPSGESPLAWFIAQIMSNVIFLYVGYLLLKVFNQFQKKGYFDASSMKVFNQIMFSCLLLAIITTARIAFSDFYLLGLSEYSSLWGIINLFALLIIDTLTFKEPQTMYFLLALIMWIVKQFILKALSYKQENEAII